MKTAIRQLILAGQPWPWSVLAALFAISDLLLTKPRPDASWLGQAQWLLTHLVLLVSLPIYARIMPRLTRRLAIFGTAFFCADTLSRVLWIVAAYPTLLPHLTLH